MHRADNLELFLRLFRIGLGQDSMSRSDQKGVLTSVEVKSILAALQFDLMFQMGNVFQLDCFSNPPCYGHFWVGKDWVGLKNVHCKVSDEPAHHTLKQGWPHKDKFINDSPGNGFISRYKNIETTSQSCLVFRCV